MLVPSNSIFLTALINGESCGTSFIRTSGRLFSLIWYSYFPESLHPFLIVCPTRWLSFSSSSSEWFPTVWSINSQDPLSMKFPLMDKLSVVNVFIWLFGQHNTIIFWKFGSNWGREDSALSENCPNGDGSSQNRQELPRWNSIVKKKKKAAIWVQTIKSFLI